MDTPLLRLPHEMVDHIAEFLSENDLLNMRLVCKEVEGATFACFRRTCFTSRTISLQLHSLETLLSISMHPRKLGSRLESLHFNLRLLREDGNSPLDLIDKRLDTFTIHSLYDPKNRLIQEYRKKLQDLARAQAAATLDGRDASLLTLALKYLGALKCIHIGHYLDARARQIDRGWYTSGVADLPSQSGGWNVPTAEMFHPESYESDGIRKILSAVVMSTSSLQTFSIGFGSHIRREAVGIPAQHLRSLKNGFSEVRTLTLLTEVSKDDDSQEGTDWLARFLALMPNIMDLDISLSGSKAAFDTVASQDFLSGLRYCAFSVFACPAEQLYLFLAKHIESLERVCLAFGGLEDGNWLPILDLLSRARLLKCVKIYYCWPGVSGLSSDYINLHLVGSTEERSTRLRNFLSGDLP